MRGGWVESGTVLIRLTRQHFAFYRAHLEGLDVGALARRYLETAIGTEDAVNDLRIASSAVTWVRAQLLIAARRSSTPTNARLLAVAPDALRVEYAQAVPSLEEFREDRDPCEIYTESELIELFQDEYGNTSASEDRRTKRNARLRAKQLQALWQLEALVAADPKLTDRVDGWIDPALAKRLQDANIQTLDDLVTAINGFGYRWHTKVPKIGEKAAAQIVRWLTYPETSAALGVTLHARGLTQKSKLPANAQAAYASRTDIVPIETLLVPASLSGENGLNRGERSLLSAHNDLSAIQAWLSKCKPGGHTARSYRKEAERFVLWSIVEKGKPISSLSVEDCIDYRDFLWDLGRVTPEIWSKRFNTEQSRWLGTRGTPRWSEFWRPFEGSLTASSQKTALVIVGALCQWLTDQHYLHGNPFKSVGRLARGTDRIDVTRALTVAEWTAIQAHLNSLEPGAQSSRIRFIFALAYSTGLRLSELAGLRRVDLRSFMSDGPSGASARWELRVLGKGDVVREVQLHSAIVIEIQRYFKQRGHHSLEIAPPNTPLIASLEIDSATGLADKPISESRLYDILKGIFKDAADSLPKSNHEMTDRLRKASTHWLRHTFATHFLQSGGELAILRDLLGHKSLDTTSIYVTTERDNRSRAMERFGDAMTANLIAINDSE